MFENSFHKLLSGCCTCCCLFVALMNTNHEQLTSSLELFQTWCHEHWLCVTFMGHLCHCHVTLLCAMLHTSWTTVCPTYQVSLLCVCHVPVMWHCHFTLSCLTFLCITATCHCYVAQVQHVEHDTHERAIPQCIPDITTANGVLRIPLSFFREGFVSIGVSPPSTWPPFFLLLKLHKKLFSPENSKKAALDS